MARKIAIVGGTGAEGSGLAYRLAKAGEHIVIGSREATRAQETAELLRERIGSTAQIEGMDNASAVAACEIAILTVPFSGEIGRASCRERVQLSAPVVRLLHMVLMLLWIPT